MSCISLNIKGELKMIYLVCFFVFAVLYALKGGSGNVFKNWDRVRGRNALLYRVMDGKVISTIGAFIFTLFITAKLQSHHVGLYDVSQYSVNFLTALLFAGGWLLSVSPSMGEEHGAVGTMRHGWGEYVEYPEAFGRSYGVKKAVQRGVWTGAIMAFVTGFVLYIPFSLLFVPCVFVGQEIYYRITDRDGWVLSEPIIGGFVYGIPTALWVTAAGG